MPLVEFDSNVLEKVRELLARSGRLDVWLDVFIHCIRVPFWRIFFLVTIHGRVVLAVVKEDQDDKAALKEYAALVAKKRGLKDKAWKEFHDALAEQL